MDACALLDAEQAGEAEWIFENATFRFKKLTADLDVGVLHAADGRDIALRPQPFAVLEYLSKLPNRFVSNEDLMRAVWGGVVVTEYSRSMRYEHSPSIGRYRSHADQDSPETRLPLSARATCEGTG